jgi:hypothetical protein
MALYLVFAMFMSLELVFWVFCNDDRTLIVLIVLIFADFRQNLKTDSW